jgi:hypothetical protein
LAGLSSFRRGMDRRVAGCASFNFFTHRRAISDVSTGPYPTPPRNVQRLSTLSLDFSLFVPTASAHASATFCILGFCVGQFRYYLAERSRNAESVDCVTSDSHSFGRDTFDFARNAIALKDSSQNQSRPIWRVAYQLPSTVLYTSSGSAPVSRRLTRRVCTYVPRVP